MKSETSSAIRIYFADYFEIDPNLLDEYGAFNISLINDLPLFIDPFLLFASEKPEYQQLHDAIITYLKFLRDKSASRSLPKGLIESWFLFPEVKQLWLGFSMGGNAGSGLGRNFAKALNENLNVIFNDFGNEKITEGTHLEKVCLVSEGVGRDNISDFTANLIKSFLCSYTQTFAQKYINPTLRRNVSVDKASFNYNLQRWISREYDLPYYQHDYVILTPKDILTKEVCWINRPDLIDGLENLTNAVPDEQLRAQLSNYLHVRLKEDMKNVERRKIISRAIKEFPKIIDYYILHREQNKDKAIEQSSLKVSESEQLYIFELSAFIQQLAHETDFYLCGYDTLQEARARVMFLKEEIENNGGYRIFYSNGQPIKRESDLQILYRLTWFATPSDFNSEVNNGRGPVDFKVSRGSKDSALVEFKLAKNNKLEQNLQTQVETYKKANRTEKALKVIFFFSEEELERVKTILTKLGLISDDSVILIDVRNDNKPSASTVKSK